MVELSFYALSAGVVAMLGYLFRGYSRSKVLLYIFMGLIIWTSYLTILSKTGVLLDFGMPPRVPLMIVFPVIAFILVIVNRNFMNQALTETSIHLPVFMQSFRILVELLIYATYLKGVFPQRATFEGLNYDILVGISALLAGFGILKGVIKPKGALIWNITSIGVLILTVYSFISTYYFSDFASTLEGSRFVEFPYLLLASVLLPAAIFLHAFSIKQILNRPKNSNVH